MKTYRVETPAGPLLVTPGEGRRMTVRSYGYLNHAPDEDSYRYRGERVIILANLYPTAGGWALMDPSSPYRRLTLSLSRSSLRDLSPAAHRIIGNQVLEAVTAWAQAHPEALAEGHADALALEVARLADELRRQEEHAATLRRELAAAEGRLREARQEVHQ